MLFFRHNISPAYIAKAIRRRAIAILQTPYVFKCLFIWTLWIYKRVMPCYFWKRKLFGCKNLRYAFLFKWIIAILNANVYSLFILFVSIIMSWFEDYKCSLFYIFHFLNIKWFLFSISKCMCSGSLTDPW